MPIHCLSNCEQLDQIIYGLYFFFQQPFVELVSVFSKQEQEELKAPTRPIQVFQMLPSDHRLDKSMLFSYINDRKK